MSDQAKDQADVDPTDDDFDLDEFDGMGDAVEMCDFDEDDIAIADAILDREAAERQRSES